jgi:hypothetical protein
MADDVEFRDLTELGELCGCTEKQTRLAEGLLAGLSQTEAAARAGYAGERDSVQLRSAVSSAARSKPVMALLALAESRGLGVPNSPGDREELVRILWAHARSKDKTSSIRASVELDRIIREERAEERVDPDPQEILREIAELAGPEFAAVVERLPMTAEERSTARAASAADWIRQNRDRARAILDEPEVERHKK